LLEDQEIQVMTHEEAFIQAIRETPHDDAPRLIYADWLEEHGQADRAEFIRLQCRFARLTEDKPERSVLCLRAESLLRRHWDEWVGPLRAIVGPWRDRYGERWMAEEYPPTGLHRFERGFVDALALDAENLLRHADYLKRLVPLRELRLWRAGRCADRLAEEPLLAGLSVLSFNDYYDSPLTAGDVAALANSPYLHGLSALYMGGNSLGDDGVEALTRAAWLIGVTVLDLSDNGLSDRALHTLAACPNGANLRKLFVQNNYFSPAGIEALRSSPNLPSLTDLDYHHDYPRLHLPSRNVFLLGGSGSS
jgi:uncharacterized protein (TIGR02996 family)